MASLSDYFATLVQMNGGGLAGCLVRGAQTIFRLGTGPSFLHAWLVPVLQREFFPIH